MNNYTVIQQVILGEQNKSTGKTRHVVSGSDMPLPAMLRIVRFPNDQGYYLLYLDKAGRELTDTYHDTLADAVDQARWEYEVQPEQWETVEQ